MPISYGRPRLPLAAPFCVISASAVSMAYIGTLATLTSTHQRNEFVIIGRFPFPSDPTQIIELQKVTLANELIGSLQGSNVFAGVGLYPLVTKVDWADPDDPDEKVFEVALTFEVLTQG
jgi:hypothetical protein